MDPRHWRRRTPALRFGGVLVAIAVALAVAGGQNAQAEGCSADCSQLTQSPTLFAGSFWSNPLPKATALSPQSANYVKRLRASVRRDGAWINTTEWSTPVYTVGSDQPTVGVTLDQPPGFNVPLRQALAAVPIPDDARPSVDRDAHMVILQPSTDRMWEFWGARKTLLDGWHTRFGGMMENVSQNPGYFPSAPGWGATATGLPLIGGLMRASELAAGRINHVLSIAIPDVRANVYAWPAQRTDGPDESAKAIPEGTRFRLNPKLKLSKLDLPPVTKAMARAAQRYGVVVSDGASNVTFYAEDPAPLGFNPYFPSPDALFGGESPAQLLQDFPWKALKVVKTQLSQES
jgi:hypothetical protein